MNFDLVAIEPVALNAKWPKLRSFCERALRSGGDQITLADDIYAEARVGNAVVFEINDEDEAEELGFMVTKLVRDPDGAALFIWVLSARNGVLREHKDPFIAKLDELAKTVKAKRIRGYSLRDGFWDQGFELRSHVYEREVDHYG